MPYDTTTLSRIVALYDAAGQLLAQEDGLSESDQVTFADIRKNLDQYWERERAERVYAQHGPPRIVGALDPGSIRQIERAVAHGIAPLPMPGGD